MKESMGVWEYGSMGVWEYESVGSLLTSINNTPSLDFHIQLNFFLLYF